MPGSERGPRNLVRGPRKAGDTPLVLRSFVGASSTGILLLDTTPDAVDPNHRASRRWADERTVRYDAYA